MGKGREDQDQLQQAIEGPEERDFRAAARHYGVDKSVLSRCLTGKVDATIGADTLLLPLREAALEQWICQHYDRGFPGDQQMVEEKAIRILGARRIKVKSLSNRWCYDFRTLHPNIRVRKVEALDRNRAASINPTIIVTLYSMLERLYNEHKYPPEAIFNADETGSAFVHLQCL